MGIRKEIERILDIVFKVRVQYDNRCFGEKGYWVGSYECYIHIESSLLKLYIGIYKEFRDERHLIG